MIPKSCCIYPELVFEDRQLGKSMQKLASAAGEGIEVVALATFLAREKMKGSESSYKPFIDVLPWDSLHPLLWTDEEVDLLEGTYAHREILAFREQVEVATELLEPVLNPKGWKQFFQTIETEKMTPEEFGFMMRGAFASVLSRAFDSKIGRGDKGLEERVVIPLLDIFNHGSYGPSITFDTALERDNEKGFPVRVADKGKSIEEGEELFGFYGDKPK